MDGIDLDVAANATLVFTTYLIGAYDVLQVRASHGADQNATYAGGLRYGKNGISDADMEDWTDWSVHPSWDSAFKLAGTLLTPTYIDDRTDATPAGFELHRNYPNPFNPETQIAFRLVESGEVTLTIFNALGQAVRTLVRGHHPAGEDAVTWDGRDDAGQLLGSGLYFYRLQVGHSVQARRMLYLR